MQSVPAGVMRPHLQYRDAFYRRILDFRPSSVVDVGCGKGGLVRRLTADGISACGVEPRPMGASDAGFKLLPGTADILPFAEGEVDWVVSEFSLHHFPDPVAALREAARVARVGVAVLDQWYDPSINSQRIAERYDRWCKAIDRRSGMVHNDSITTGRMMELLVGADAGFTVELRTMLIPINIPMERLRSIAREVLAVADSPAEFRPMLNALLADAEEQGFTDDGAIMAFAYRSK